MNLEPSFRATMCLIDSAWDVLMTLTQWPWESDQILTVVSEVLPNIKQIDGSIKLVVEGAGGGGSRCAGVGGGGAGRPATYSSCTYE